jgi:hypothetical protein
MRVCLAQNKSDLIVIFGCTFHIYITEIKPNKRLQNEMYLRFIRKSDFE